MLLGFPINISSSTCRVGGIEVKFQHVFDIFNISHSSSIRGKLNEVEEGETASFRVLAV